jgi:hypothetical protein
MKPSNNNSYLDKLLFELYDRPVGKLLKESEDELYAETKHLLDAALEEKPRLTEALHSFERKGCAPLHALSGVRTYLTSLAQIVLSGQVPALVAGALAVVAILLNVMPLTKTPVQDLEPRSAWETRQEGNRSISRETATLLKQKIAAALGSPWRRTGLLVGVSSYKDKRAVPPIPFAVSEVKEAGRIVSKDMGVGKDGVMWLMDEYASEAALRAAVFYFRSFASPNDTLFIHLSCHGVRSADSSVKFQMYDSSPDGGVSLEEILALLGPFRGRVLIVADACYSANMPMKTPIPERVWVLASAGEDQQAFGPKSANSVFSDSWFKALSGQADMTGDGIVTLKEAFEWTVKQMETSGQRPSLYGSGDADDLILSMAPNLWDMSPPRSPQPEPPASLKLVSDLSVEVDLYLDGIFMGRLSQGDVVLPLAPGLHDVRVRAEGSDPENTETMWMSQIQAASGEALERIVILNPPVHGFLPVGGPLGEGCFPKLVKNPDGLGAVDARWDSDGTLIISFRPTRHSSGQTYSAAFVAERLFGGVNAAALLGAKPVDTLALWFDVRTEKPRMGAPVFVHFFIGGTGGDSLKTRRSKDVEVSNVWREVEIPFPSTDGQGLVAGLGVQVHPSVGPLSLCIRDARIILKAKDGKEP